MTSEDAGIHVTSEDAADQGQQGEKSAKRERRNQIRAGRMARSAIELDQADTKMAERILTVLSELPQGDIAVYISMPGEPPTNSLRRQLKERGHRLLIPKVDGSDLLWAIDSEETNWEMNSFGTQEPVNNFVENQQSVLHECVAIVVPAHAIDQQGLRLGQGKGFYDRALEFTRHSTKRPLIVGLTFEDEYLDSVPHEPHDIPVDVSVTESAVRWFKSPD